MYLMIDLSEKDMAELAFFDEKKIKRSFYSGKNGEVVHWISDFLSKQKFYPVNIKGIMVVEGDGSFTSVRLSTTVANIFSYILKIPVLPINKEQAKNPIKFIPKLLSCVAGNYISAVYKGEPNLGKN